MLSVFAEFESNLRRERQMDGINAAKARGVYKGRKPSIKPDESLYLRKEGLGATVMAKKLGVDRASVYPGPDRITGNVAVVSQFEFSGTNSICPGAKSIGVMRPKT
jgi:DNA invertase Pin-like site-specific DNA recombinase